MNSEQWTTENTVKNWNYSWSTGSTAANSAKKPQRKSLPELPSEQTGSVDTTVTKSSAEQLENSKSTTDLIREPIRAQVTPDEHELSG